MIPTCIVPALPGRPRALAVRGRTRGFTLVELMITLAVAGVVATLGAPSFLRLLARHAVSAQADELQDAVRLARSEAMKRSGPVVLCRTEAANTSRCAGSGGSWQTWLLFADAGRTGAFVVGDALLRQRLEASGRATVVGSAASIRFEATGIARADNGAPVVIVLAPAGPGGSGELAWQRQLCVDPRGEVAVIAGGAPCP